MTEDEAQAQIQALQSYIKELEQQLKMLTLTASALITQRNDAQNALADANAKIAFLTGASNTSP